MGNFNTRATIGNYGYIDGSNMTFAGAETRYSSDIGYIGVGGFVASEDFKNPYGLFDIKGKLNYDKKGIVYHVNSSVSPEETHRQVVQILGE